MRVCVGSPGTFSTRKCRSATLAICGRCVIVITCARSASRCNVSRDAVRRLAADACVDLVEDHRLAATDGGDRERDPRELSTGGGLGDRRERQARVRPDQERDRRRRRSARAPAPAARPRTRRRPCRRRRARVRPPRRNAAPPRHALRAARRRDAASALSAAASASAAAAAGSKPSSIASSSARARMRRGEQLFVRLGPEASLRVGDAVELLLDLLEPARLRLERRQEAAELARGLAKPELDVAQLVAGARQLRREALERCHRSLRRRGQSRSTLAFVGSKRRGGRSGALCELGHVAQTLPLVAEALLRPGLHPGRVLDERAQPGEPCNFGVGSRLQLLVPFSRGRQLAPRPACFRTAAQLAPRRRRSRALQAGMTCVRGGAARTAPTSRSAARRPRRDPPARQLVPRHTRACARPRRRDARGRDRPRPAAVAPPATRTPPRPAVQAADRARPPRRPRRRPARCTRHPPSPRAGARSPARGSSCRRRSRR